MNREDDNRKKTILEAAKELRSDEPAPGVEEIVEFVAGRSSPEATERVRDHVTFETGPRQMVRDLAALQRGEAREELSSQEVDDDWQTLQARIEAEQIPSDVGSSPSDPSAKLELEELRPARAPIRRWRQAVSDVLAASFLLTTIGLGYQWMTQGEGPLGFSEVITLGERVDQTRNDQPTDGDWQRIEAEGPAFALSLRFDRSMLSEGSTLEIRFFEETGNLLKILSMPAGRNPLDTPKVLVSRDWLPSGRHRITILGIDKARGDRIPVGEYRIQLSYLGDRSE